MHGYGGCVCCLALILLRKIITGGADKTIRTFTSFEDEDVTNIEYHEGPITALAVKVRPACACCISFFAVLDIPNITFLRLTSPAG